MEAIDESAFAATDYHLDWLHAALLLASGSVEVGKPHPNVDQAIATGNQEDIDLLVAVERREAIHLVLIEAKADAGFTNTQLLSKAERLGRIFDSDGTRFPGVIPHFVLISPREPSRRLNVTKWPTWMKPAGKAQWLPLSVPAARRRVTRCDANGKPSKRGGHFVISHGSWRGV
jgi:hypothetical protein